VVRVSPCHHFSRHRLASRQNKQEEHAEQNPPATLRQPPRYSPAPIHADRSCRHCCKLSNHATLTWLSRRSKPTKGLAAASARRSLKLSKSPDWLRGPAGATQTSRTRSSSPSFRRKKKGSNLPPNRVSNRQVLVGGFRTRSCSRRASLHETIPAGQIDRPRPSGTLSFCNNFHHTSRKKHHYETSRYIFSVTVRDVLEAFSAGHAIALRVAH
jgi:hypothetical protein